MKNTNLYESPNPVDVHVGQQLRGLRHIKQKTQVDLAEYLDLTFQQIQKYEKGTNRIAASRLYQICTFLKVQPNEFFLGLDGIPAKEDSPRLSRKESKLITSFRDIEKEETQDKLLQLIATMKGESN